MSSHVEIKLAIEGMSCGHCSGTVLKALQGIEGVSNATVDLAGKSGVVECDPAAAASLKPVIAEKIIALGFTSTFA